MSNFWLIFPPLPRFFSLVSGNLLPPFEAMRRSLLFFHPFLLEMEIEAWNARFHSPRCSRFSFPRKKTWKLLLPEAKNGGKCVKKPDEIKWKLDELCLGSQQVFHTFNLQKKETTSAYIYHIFCGVEEGLEFPAATPSDSIQFCFLFPFRTKWSPQLRTTVAWCDVLPGNRCFGPCSGKYTPTPPLPLPLLCFTSCT